MVAYGCNTNMELQQRSVEYSCLFNNFDHLRYAVWSLLMWGCGQKVQNQLGVRMLKSSYVLHRGLTKTQQCVHCMCGGEVCETIFVCEKWPLFWNCKKVRGMQHIQ